MNQKKNKVFFSAAGGPVLRNWCTAHRIELFDLPLIAFSPVESFPVCTPDIIFYSSPRSVIFSSKIRQAFPAALSATIGKATSQQLEAEHIDVHFTGETAGDPEKVAESFKAWVGKRRVLFPVSDRSLGSISKAIPADQKEELVVYRTELIGKTMEPLPIFDILVFTSPSNWQSFLQNNAPSGTIVAWGKSTAKSIMEGFQGELFILENPDESALVALLQRLIK